MTCIQEMKDIEHDKLFLVLLTEFSNIFNANAIYSLWIHKNALNDRKTSKNGPDSPKKMEKIEIKNGTINDYVPQNKFVQIKAQRI